MALTALNVFSKFPTLKHMLPLDMLVEANGVIYGSRGLHINQENSDYDFAFSYETHVSLFNKLMYLNIPKSDSTSYFESVPEAGYHSFFQHIAIDKQSETEVKVDILFLHNDEDLDVVRASVQDLQSIPQYMLQDKKFRILAYNKALRQRGWSLLPPKAPQISVERSHRRVLDDHTWAMQRRMEQIRDSERTSSWF